MFNVGDEVSVKAGYGRPFTGKIIKIKLHAGIGGGPNYDIQIEDTYGNTHTTYDTSLELVQSTAQSYGPLDVHPGASHLSGIFKVPQPQSWGCTPVQVYATSGSAQVSQIASFKKCECGSHSVGVDRHSDYCPLYVKN